MFTASDPNRFADIPRKPAFSITSTNPVKRGTITVKASVIPELNTVCIVAYDSAHKLPPGYSVRFFHADDDHAPVKYVEQIFESQNGGLLPPPPNSDLK